VGNRTAKLEPIERQQPRLRAVDAKQLVRVHRPAGPGADLSERDASPVAAKLLLSLVTLVLCFLILEFAIRIVSRESLRWENFLARELSLRHAAYPVAFDRRLGWVPEPGRNDRENLWHTQVTIDDQGLRTNGPASLPRTAPLVLALGDSFTFGDEVSDDESWPAALEREIQRSVVNAGVFAYGVDQAVLRGETLMPSYRPAVIVYGLFGDDSARCELSIRKGIGKPWFRLDGAGLAAEAADIVPPTASAGDLDWARQILGHSLLFDRLIRTQWPSWWLEGVRRTVREHSDGVEVSARLMGRLAADAEQHHARVLVVALYDRRVRDEERRACAPVLDRALVSGLAVLDLAPKLIELRSRDPRAHARLYGAGHFSAAGNAWAATRIAEVLRADPRFQEALALAP